MASDWEGESPADGWEGEAPKAVKSPPPRADTAETPSWGSELWRLPAALAAGTGTSIVDAARQSGRGLWETGRVLGKAYKAWDRGVPIGQLADEVASEYIREGRTNSARLQPEERFSTSYVPESKILGGVGKAVGWTAERAVDALVAQGVDRRKAQAFVQQVLETGGDLATILGGGAMLKGAGEATAVVAKAARHPVRTAKAAPGAIAAGGRAAINAAKRPGETAAVVRDALRDTAAKGVAAARQPAQTVRDVLRKSGEEWQGAGRTVREKLFGTPESRVGAIFAATDVPESRNAMVAQGAATGITPSVAQQHGLTATETALRGTDINFARRTDARRRGQQEDITGAVVGAFGERRGDVDALLAGPLAEAERLRAQKELAQAGVEVERIARDDARAAAREQAVQEKVDIDRGLTEATWQSRERVLAAKRSAEEAKAASEAKFAAAQDRFYRDLEGSGLDVRELVAAEQARLAGAVEEASAQASTVIGEHITPTEQRGQGLQRRGLEREKAMSDTMSQLYGKASTVPVDEIGVGQLRAAVEEVNNAIPDLGKQTPAFDAVKRRIDRQVNVEEPPAGDAGKRQAAKGPPAEVTVGELNALRSDVMRLERAARDRLDAYRLGVFKDKLDAIEDSLVERATKAGRDIKVLRKAREYARDEYYPVWGRNGPGWDLLKARGGRPIQIRRGATAEGLLGEDRFQTAAESLGERYLPSTPSEVRRAKQNFDRVFGDDPGARADLLDAVRVGILDARGNPKLVRRWLDEHAAALRAYGLDDAFASVEQALSQADAASLTLREFNAAQLTKTLGVDVEKAMPKLLGSLGAEKTLRSAAQLAETNPAARQGLQRVIADTLRGMGGKQRKTAVESVRRSGVFSDGEFQRLQRALAAPEKFKTYWDKRAATDAARIAGVEAAEKVGLETYRRVAQDAKATVEQRRRDAAVPATKAYGQAAKAAREASTVQAAFESSRVGRLLGAQTEEELAKRLVGKPETINDLLSRFDVAKSDVQAAVSEAFRPLLRDIDLSTPGGIETAALKARGLLEELERTTKGTGLYSPQQMETVRGVVGLLGEMDKLDLGRINVTLPAGPWNLFGRAVALLMERSTGAWGTYYLTRELTGALGKFLRGKDLALFRQAFEDEAVANSLKAVYQALQTSKPQAQVIRDVVNALALYTPSAGARERRKKLYGADEE